MGYSKNRPIIQIDNKELSLRLAEKALQSDLDTANQNITDLELSKASKTELQAIASGSPKGTYATLSALQTALPTGDTNIYVVTADGKWYYWNGSAWAAGGVYQSTGIAKHSVSYDKTDFLTVGKNLYNSAKSTPDYYVDYRNGNLVADTLNQVSDFVPIEPNATYTLSNQNMVGQTKDLSQLAFYDSAKNYVSGLPNTGLQQLVTFTTPSNVYYMRFSFENTKNEGLMIEKGSSMTTYELFMYVSDKLIVSRLEKGIVDDKHILATSNIVVKKIGKNLLDISKVTTAYYVDYTSGNLAANADSKVTDYVALLPNTTYTLSSQISGDLSQLAFYNQSKTYVSGLSNIGLQEYVTFTTGANVYYMRLSISVTVTDGVMLEEGSVMTEFEPSEIRIRLSDLPSTVINQTENIITVKQDGTGNFASLREAIDSIADASKSNPYTVEIHEGLYDILNYYTTEEMNNTSFDGLRKPDYVSIKGVGDKRKIKVQLLMPDDNLTITATSKGRISTFCPLGNGDMENVTFIGENLRYTIHDDYNFPYAKLHVKNCDFIRYKGNGINYGGKQAWGEGSWDGQLKIFEDCYFYTEWDNYFAYTTHNVAGETKLSRHKFINCKFFSTLSPNAIRFSSLDGQEEEVEMIGCKYNSAIVVEPIDPYTGNKYTIKGYGNEKMPVSIKNTDAVTHTYEFLGETQEMYNGGANAITKGQPVMLNSGGTSIIPFIGNGKIRYYGIAMHDTPIGSKGMVRIAGYLPISKTNLTGLVIGDMIGITNGALTKVTAGEYIGFVALTDYIQLV